ncbi:MAG: hypothetical protein WBD16_12020 [Pyrinomonadaceae bacterium]
MTRATSAIVFFLIIGFGLGGQQALGQALVLLSRSSPSRGTGACDNIEFSVVSKFWRVKKGDTFQVFARWSETELEGLSYLWTVDNGQIISGQGSNRIEVKAGKKKTSGYVNATGFVEIDLAVSKSNAETRCTVSASTTVMVGHHRESSGFANVEGISLNKPELEACEPTSEDKDEKIVEIVTVATDPENDVLSYEYRVTAGKIIGQGAKVKWDLTGVPPGSYTVSVRADDGSGISNTKSAKLSVTNCSQN